MLTLDLPIEPYWIDQPRGFRVEIRPVTTAVMAAAFRDRATGPVAAVALEGNG